MRVFGCPTTVTRAPGCGSSGSVCRTPTEIIVLRDGGTGKTTRNRVAKFNEGSLARRCPWCGRSGTPQGVAAWAGLEAARRQGERDDWRQVRKLPEGKLPPKAVETGCLSPS